MKYTRNLCKICGRGRGGAVGHVVDNNGVLLIIDQDINDCFQQHAKPAVFNFKNSEKIKSKTP